MQHTIYFGQKPLILTTGIPVAVLSRYPAGEILIVKQTDNNAIQQVLEWLGQPSTAAGILIHSNPEIALKAIKKHFHFLQAAGGLVWTDKKSMLLIFRKGKWDLPKGKLDPGESLEQCAVREVEEETGLQNVGITKYLCKTYHTYYQEGNHYLKESHWYLMHAPQTKNLQPQVEEDIEQCVWTAPSALESYLTNTHPSIADVLTFAMPLLTGEPE